jgi:hypothetical protein
VEIVRLKRYSKMRMWERNRTSELQNSTSYFAWRILGGRKTRSLEFMCGDCGPKIWFTPSYVVKYGTLEMYDAVIKGKTPGVKKREPDTDHVCTS